MDFIIRGHSVKLLSYIRSKLLMFENYLDSEELIVRLVILQHHWI